jgi:hypothetical protein
MTNEVIRDGEVFHKAVVDVYDFDQQGTCDRLVRPVFERIMFKSHHHPHNYQLHHVE